MFLGIQITTTRTGQRWSFSSQEVGALHISQKGYTQVEVEAGTEINTFNLRDGWNLLTWPNITTTAVVVTWTGTATEAPDYNNAKLYKTDLVLEDEQGHQFPTNYIAEFLVPRSAPHGSAENVASSHSFEFRYLSWDSVDVLEEIFNRHGGLGNPVIWLIPNSRSGESYEVVQTSPHDFYQSNPQNFDSGSSGALVFNTINPIEGTT